MMKCLILLTTALLITLVTSIPTSGKGETQVSLSEKNDEIECKAQCKVTLEYKPLCGKDGRTYPNEPALNCRNDCAKKQGKVEVEIAHEGKCPTNRPKTVPRV